MAKALRSGPKWLAAVLSGCIAVCGGAAHGQDESGPVKSGHGESGVTAKHDAAGDEKAPWRGSTIIYRNAATALSLDKSADLTYNPYYAMAFEVDPYWWFGDVFYVCGTFSVSREFTDSDTTTERGEWELADTTLTIGAQSFVTVPLVGIDVSAAVVTAFPTSKLSRARTMIIGTTGQLVLSRTFGWLAGFNVALAGIGTRYVNEYTTSENESPIIASCAPTDFACEAFLNSGIRNPRWRLAGQLSVTQDFTGWLGLTGSAALVNDYLYHQETADAEISYEPQEGTDNRYYMVFGAEVYTTPMPSLAIALGAATESPQLKPDSTYEKPFFNRYTVLYGDVRIKIDGLISQLTSTEETP